MCGIYGIIGEFDTTAFVNSGESMAHRGPDSKGEYHDGGIHLGHRRLAIIDLSDAGSQPMKTDDGNEVIVYNGEIYNFKEVKKLLHRGQFFSETDTEVLLYGYQQFGIDGLLDKIKGMFAFAIWNREKQELHLVRDHVGKKPLFYALQDGSLYFASTLNSLLELLPFKPQINNEAINHYFIKSYIPAPLTIYKNIYKLPAAHRMVYSLLDKTIKVIRYWQPKFQKYTRINEGELIEQTEDLIIQAVKRRLISDVPVGAFLSGGIDSSLVSAIMTKKFNFNLSTFTINFQNKKFDEGDIAKKTARSIGADHHEIEFNAGNINLLRQIAHQYGEPFGDHSALPTYHLAKYAKERITVALTGDGGDEGFAGYNSHLALYSAQKLQFLYSNNVFRQLLQGFSGASKMLKWINTLNARRGGVFYYDPMGDKGFRNSADSLFRHNDTLHQIDQPQLEIWNEKDLDWVDRGIKIGLYSSLPDALLTKTDVSTMFCSLEARAPLLDIDLLEHSFRIPSSIKLKGYSTKHILRVILNKYLPGEVTRLPKKGFSLPVEEYLLENKSEIIELVNSIDWGFIDNINAAFVGDFIKEYFRGNRRGHHNQVWLILMFSLWYDNYRKI